MLEKEKDSSATLVRRLAQLKSAFMKKIEETRQAVEAWNRCRTSKYLFDKISQCFNEAKQKFDLVITTTEELKMVVVESVWESDYQGKKAELEA